MNCTVHSERAAVRGCSGCGRPFCEECLSRSVDQATCETCAAGAAAAPKAGTATWVWVLLAIIGACLVFGCIIAIIAAIAIPNLIEARKTGNETAAIGALRTIASVQAQFREGDREGDRNLDYATSLAELSNAGLIDNVLGQGMKRGYVFTLSGSTYDWKCSATPVSNNTGGHNFIVCTDGVVRFSSSGAANCMSAAIE